MNDKLSLQSSSSFTHIRINKAIKSSSLKMKRSSSTILNEKLQKNLNSQQISPFFNLKINEQIQKPINSASKTKQQKHFFYQTTFTQSQNEQQINFLKAIVNKKKAETSTQMKQSNFNNMQITNEKKKKLKNQYQQSIRSVAKQYDYYDFVVQDLISYIRLKNSQKKQQVNISPPPKPQRKFTQLKIRPKPADGDFYNIKFMERNQELRSLSINKFNKKKETMIFRMNDFVSDRVYERKMNSYLEFIYKINFSNEIYVDLSLNKYDQKYYVKIGKGNNSLLIKSLLKRRFWLEFDSTDKQALPVFTWSQDSRSLIHNSQTNIKPNRQDERYSNKNNCQYTQLADNISNYNKLLPKKQNRQAAAFFFKSNGFNSIFPTQTPGTISNHLPQNSVIGSKKILFLLMKWYYQEVLKVNSFQYIPRSYYLRARSGMKEKDDLWKLFVADLAKETKQKLWIVKPGQNTNRGRGISLATSSEVERSLKRQLHKSGEEKTYIVQQYLNPFLYQSRKFDIRHFLLITSVNGYIKAYWFNEGYIRTSSETFDAQDISNQFIHLTNDAVQKKSDDYGKYEPGNKLSYYQFQRYLDNTYPHKKYNFTKLVQSMKKITTDIVRASFQFLDPYRKGHNFQLFGMDFMIDKSFNPYLIEINSNPCLQTTCPLLNRIIPVLCQHTFRLALDPLLPPPQNYHPKHRYYLSDRIQQKIKYELIFDEKLQGNHFVSLIKQSKVKFKDVLSDVNVSLQKYVQQVEMFEQDPEKQGTQQKNIEIIEDDT